MTTQKQELLEDRTDGMLCNVCNELIDVRLAESYATGEMLHFQSFQSFRDLKESAQSQCQLCRLLLTNLDQIQIQSIEMWDPDIVVRITQEIGQDCSDRSIQFWYFSLEKLSVWQHLEVCAGEMAGASMAYGMRTTADSGKR